MRLKALLIDLDGVLRQWPSNDAAIEISHGLALGSIRTAAFEPSLLAQAITGQISDDAWREKIAEALQVQRGGSELKGAILQWSAQLGKINQEVLAVITSLPIDISLVLVTNATSRLDDDLSALGLNQTFTAVVNSSAIGVVKPNRIIFDAALAEVNCLPNEAVFIDDSPQNVEAALALGIVAHQFVNVEMMKNFLSTTGIIDDSN